MRDQQLERVGARGEERESRTNVPRGVMESAADGDLLVVDPVRVERHAGVARQPAEREHRTARAHELERPLPGVHRSDGLDHDVGTHAVCQDGAELRRQCAPLIAAADADRRRTGVTHAGAQHQTDRAEADDGDRVALADTRRLDSVEAAGERLDHRRDLRGEPVGDTEHGPVGDARRDEQVLGVRAVEQREQPLAQGLLAAPAGRARSARGRVRRHHPASRGHVDAAELVPERARRRPEEDRVPTPKRLGVGAVGQRHLDLHEHVSLGLRLGSGNVLEPEVSGAVKDQRAHPTVTSRARYTGTWSP